MYKHLVEQTVKGLNKRFAVVCLNCLETTTKNVCEIWESGCMLAFEMCYHWDEQKHSLRIIFRFYFHRFYFAHAMRLCSSFRGGVYANKAQSCVLIRCQRFFGDTGRSLRIFMSFLFCVWKPLEISAHAPLHKRLQWRNFSIERIKLLFIYLFIIFICSYAHCYCFI